MLLKDVPWIRPVTIKLQCGMERTFGGVYDALDFLENEWPLRHGERYDRSLQACRGALNGTVASVVARDAFIAACLEAGLAATVNPCKPDGGMHGHPRPSRITL